MDKHQILQQYFGYTSFKEGQETLIDRIVDGCDVLGVMPTGAGKSICFQVPAMLFAGITIVVSPLISLMKDQVNALTQVGIKAAYLNSSLTYAQYQMALKNARNGLYKIIYVAPERLLTEEFLSFAQSTKVSMLTVDEAHCVSQWGQDFRPSYLMIVDFVKQLPSRPVISAFTATATHRVRQDILQGLQLQDPLLLVTGFDRKNLFFSVQKPADQTAALFKFLQERKGKSGIVYCSTRKAVEEVCEKLRLKGYEAQRYHAGLPDEERKRNQDAFLYDRVCVMVATNAFGMGIDKSNVSFVVHYNMPKDIESYYQEAGRAGRDGQAADCLLLYSPKDVHTQLYLINHREAKEELDRSTEELIKQRERAKLKQMTLFCTTKDCLRQYILRYFGESAQECGDNCSNCSELFDTIDITLPAQKILSCVSRVSERFGSQMVIDVLRGSQNERVKKLKLDQLPTYNIMTESDREIKEMINALLAEEYLMRSNDEYPLLQLGKRAQEVLNKKVSVQMKQRKETQEAAIKRGKSSFGNLTIAAGDADPALMARLKKLRFSIASQQKVPAFVVFSDATLDEMCKRQPRTDEDFLLVPGVGEVKLERYGQNFLKEIAVFVQEEKENNVD